MARPFFRTDCVTYLAQRWFLALCVCSTLGGPVVVSPVARAAPPAEFAAVTKEYTSSIRPLLARSCLKCHNADKREGDLDLKQIESLTDLRRNPQVWQKVQFMLINGEMPPRDSTPLPPTARQKIQSWIRRYLDVEARAQAGDPGRVVLRRLNNLEYANTVRDLTHVDLNLTAEFPTDSAAGEGFTNTGDALVMSPALLGKYLAAARTISNHAVLLPDGFRFSQATTRRDWTDEIVAQIRDIHARHTQLYEERDRGNVTRIQWGHVDLAPYLTTLLEHRERLRTDTNSAAEIAAAAGLNAIYLGHLARLLSAAELSPLLARIRARIRSAQPEQASAILDEIKAWQAPLWELKNVGQMFNQGLAPVDPLIENQTFRIKLAPPAGSQVATLSMQTSDAGERHPDDRVVWQNPRLERPGLPPLLLRDVRSFLTRLGAFREQILRQTEDYLAAAATVTRDPNSTLSAVAKQHQLDSEILRSWMDYLNLQPASEEFAAFAPQPGRILLMVVNITDVKVGDRGLAQVLRSRGHEVTLYNPAGKTAQQQHDTGKAHDLVIISESIAAADVKFTDALSLKDLPRPIISFEPYMYDDASWTAKEVWKHFGHTGTGSATPLNLDQLSTSLYVANSEHPMALGLKGRVRVYEQPYTLAYGIPGKAATTIATADPAGAYPTTFVYEPGAQLLDGSIAPAARIGLFLGQAAADNPAGNTPLNFDDVSFNGLALVNAAVEYALDPQHVYRPPTSVLARNETRQQPAQRASLGSQPLTRKTAIWDHEFLDGWAFPNGDPAVVANRSNAPVRIPGVVRPHGIMVQPSTTHFVAAGWRSPINGLVRIEAAVVDAHPEGGNGQTWSLNFQQGASRQRLGSGTLGRGDSLQTDPIENLLVRKGDLISLTIGPRDADAACDATGINLVITENSNHLRSWNLAVDVAENLHAGNPHPDRIGNKLVWYFFSDEVGKYREFGTPLPNPSLLTRWRATALTGREAAATNLAAEITQLLTAGPGESTSSNNKRLFQQVRSATSPLFERFDYDSLLKRNDLPLKDVPTSTFGLATKTFQRDPAQPQEDAASLIVQAPRDLQVQLPADLVEGREFVVDVHLVAAAQNGNAQADVKVVFTGNTPSLPPQQAALPQDLVTLVPERPILVRANGPGRKRMETALHDFRNLFPRMMCCRTIIPLDEVVTLVQFHREDAHLSRLLLNAEEQNKLNRLWSELRYISQDALLIHEGFPLFLEFASQVGKVPRFKPLQEPIRLRAEAFRRQLADSEPVHLEALLQFAQRVFRRPLTAAEEKQVHTLYATARQTTPDDHAATFRSVLTRLLVSPSFLYRIEEPPAGDQAGPVNNWELATRLSYFLWSTLPDASLRTAAGRARLQNPDQLVQQARRMIQDARVRNLATEFTCQWLGLHGFDTFDGKNERQYPTFTKLRGDMYEEPIRFFTDLFVRNGSLLEVLDADHTFLNTALAQHYGITDLAEPGWQRVAGMKAHSRGGVLGMAAMLSSQAGASRTSPILRGNWVVETLLGERLPDPPANVPDLPDAISQEGLTVRQRTEQHVRAAECARCHRRIDPFGFALESFDAIGRYRQKDLVNQPVDARVRLPDGTTFSGLSGLRSYLLNERREDFVRQFCRKLLGYSLGRAVQLSDQPLLEQMQRELRDNDYRIWTALEAILRSRQFRFHRGLEATRETPL